MNWCTGQHVVCIGEGEWHKVLPRLNKNTLIRHPKKGEVLEIHSCDVDETAIWLYFTDRDGGYDSRKFRPILSSSQEAEVSEVILEQK